MSERWYTLDDLDVERVLLAHEAQRRQAAESADARAAGEPARPAGGRRLRLRSVATVEPRQVRWLVPGLIPRGALTLVAGIGGAGKSTFLCAVAAAVSAGRLGEPGDAIVVTFEDPAAEVVRPRLEAANADLARVHVVERADDGGLAAVRLPGDLDELRALVREVSARLLVLDPVVAAIETSLDAHKDQHVRAVLAGLARLAEEEDLAVALVGHLNKAASRDAYLRVANSVAFWNAARSVVLVTADAAAPDELRLVTQRKANWSRSRPVERHRVEPVVLPGRIDPETGRPVETSRMVFVEAADDIDPDDVLAPVERGTRTVEAEALLAAALADGDWHAAAELKAVLGLPERTLQRAAQALGVEAERRGFPSATFWRLPGPLQSRQLQSRQVGATENSAQPCGFRAPEESSRAKPGADGATGATGGSLPSGNSRSCPICDGSDFGPVSGACRRCGWRPWEPVPASPGDE
ncbi:MAG: AAA family ATPase [Rhodospirillales bacterium]|nr:AAA family ATPase [Rhodospirillales bacterium]